MKTYIALFLGLTFMLAACTPATPLPYPPSTLEPAASMPYPVGTVESSATVIIPTPTTDLTPVSYTDPTGQFRMSIPAGWSPVDEEGVFSGPEGMLKVGYLPEMAFMNSVNRVCERIANTPGGPGRKVDISPLPTADACTLTPYPEMSTDRVTMVVANRAGEPEQRYFYLETDQAHLEQISATLELLNPPAEQEEFPYPGGALRPEDEAFWDQTGTTPDELTLEEYALVEASVDNPTHLEFMERIPQDVLQKRAEWREAFRESRLDSNNELLEPFGYSLAAKPESDAELYELYQGSELIQDEITLNWPAAVSASGSDFAMVVEVRNSGYRLVRQDTLEEWDMSASLYIPPIFNEDELLHVVWDSERSQVQVMQGQEQIFAFASLFLVDMPVKGLWSWDEHWMLEVDGFLIQDGQVLNESLGFEEIFGWQLLDGKPFYYFRKGPRVGISYDGSTLPFYYDEVIHYRCCEPAMFNNSGNENMAWFYGLRDGMWYYVEIGAFEE